MTVRSPTSWAGAAGVITAGVPRRRAPAASCFHSSSYTRPRRVRRSPVDSGFGGVAWLEVCAGGAMEIEQPPLDGAGVGAGVGAGFGGVVPLPPPHPAIRSAAPTAAIGTPFA